MEKVAVLKDSICLFRCQPLPIKALKPDNGLGHRQQILIGRDRHTEQSGIGDGRVDLGEEQKLDQQRTDQPQSPADVSNKDIPCVGESLQQLIFIAGLQGKDVEKVDNEQQHPQNGQSCNAFQLFTAPKIAIVARIGLDRGRIILVNTCMVLAPSMRALSSREAGMDST